MSQVGNIITSGEHTFLWDTLALCHAVVRVGNHSGALCWTHHTYQQRYCLDKLVLINDKGHPLVIRGEKSSPCDAYSGVKHKGLLHGDWSPLIRVSLVFLHTKLDVLSWVWVQIFTVDCIQKWKDCNIFAITGSIFVFCYFSPSAACSTSLLFLAL